MKKIVPILTISTKVQRQTVSINGSPYPLRTRDEIALLSPGKAPGARFVRLGSLLSVKAPSKAQARDRHRLLGELTALMLDAPAAVLAKLEDIHRLAIMQAFLETLPAAAKSSKM